MCGQGCTKFFNVVLSLAGLGLSLYSLYVETKLKNNTNEATMEGKYKPMCDIDLDFSCSVVFKSSYAKGFGQVEKFLGKEHPLNQPNSVYGIAFYSFMILLSLVNRKFVASLQILLSLTACGVSCYLGYLLYFVIKSVCVVCVATYAVNFLLLVFSLCKRRSLSTSAPRKDNYGYYIPTTTTPANNNFKKYI